ncbi:MAG: tetratricopeptide repeat protein, partial [Holophaga sp.]
MKFSHSQLWKKAQALGSAGNTSEAAKAYRAFLDVEPGEAEAWAEYAGKLVKLGQFEAAEKACQTSLHIAPN